MRKILLLVVFFVCIIGPMPSQAATRGFQYAAKDGFNMTGNIYFPNSIIDKKVPLVILLHSIGSSKEEWKDLPDMITKRGYACLSLDLRGHGQSILNKKLKQRSWVYFTNADYAKYPSDVLYSLDAVKAQFAKKIDTTRIIFVGNNIGASTSVIVASKIAHCGAPVKSIVMISPRMTVKGLAIPVELVNYGSHPVVIFTNKNVKSGYSEALELQKYAQGKCVIKALNSQGMGAALYKSVPSIKTDTVNWVVSIFGKP